MQPVQLSAAGGPALPRERFLHFPRAEPSSGSLEPWGLLNLPCELQRRDRPKNLPLASNWWVPLPATAESSRLHNTKDASQPHKGAQAHLTPRLLWQLNAVKAVISPLLPIFRFL